VKEEIPLLDKDGRDLYVSPFLGLNFHETNR